MSEVSPRLSLGCIQYLYIMLYRTMMRRVSTRASVSTLRPGQNGCRLADTTLMKYIFLNENFCIMIKILLNFVPYSQIDKQSALV